MATGLLRAALKDALISSQCASAFEAERTDDVRSDALGVADSLADGQVAGNAFRV